MARGRGARARGGMVLRLSGLAVAAGMVYVGVTAVQVWETGRRDERETADAIVVLGAAQYDGRPSPVLQARLDHALRLYEAGVAPYVTVTGGKQPTDRVTEAWTSYRYLMDRGVPDAAVLPITDGTDTWESLAAAGRILRERSLERVVLVSSPTHALRTKVIAEELGLDAQVSSTDPRARLSGTTLREVTREAVAVAAGRVLGHARLANLNRRLAADASPAPSAMALAAA